MLGYVSIPQENIDQAIAQVKAAHQQAYGSEPTSLVWALAYEAIASEIRTNLAKQQVEIAGLTFEVNHAA